jgi:DNA replication protein DnaC
MSLNGRVFVTPDEVHKLKEATIGVICKGKCGGTGSLVSKNVIADCECLTEFRLRLDYLCAGIPKKYWNFTFDDLLPAFTKANTLALKLITNYIQRISEMISNGVGLYIQGKSGLAKSALASCILKEAKILGCDCYCIRMSQLTKLVFESLEDPDKRNMLKWLKDDVQLLVIDEIDKDYRVQNIDGFAGNQINEFFGDVYNSQKALIVTSNLAKKDLSKVHALNVVDRLSELVDVVLVGESYRNQGDALKKIMEE